MTSDVVDQKTSRRYKIVRALLCAAGRHEAWEQYNITGYKEMETVYVNMPTFKHGELHCCVCKHCRTVYVRRRDE